MLPCFIVKAAAILVAAFVLWGRLGPAISLNIPEKVVRRVLVIVILFV